MDYCFSSSNPNGQNISKGKNPFKRIDLSGIDLSIRSVFGPAAGREWWAIDYGQIQLVTLAYASGDPKMIAAVEAGMDFHDFMAREIFGIPDGEEVDDGERRIGKNVNFGFVFGAQPKKIEETARKPGLWDILCDLFPAAIEFLAANQKSARTNGYIDCVGGYRLEVPHDRPYAATNYLVQGTEGEIVKMAYRMCWERLQELPFDAWIALQVHDEFVFDFPAGEGEKYIGEMAWCMEEAARKIGVPCPVDGKFIDDNWAEGIGVDFYQQAV